MEKNDSVDTTVFINDSLEYTEYRKRQCCTNDKRQKCIMFTYTFFVCLLLFGGIGFIGIWMLTNH